MNRSYGQYCALAKTLDVVGERWTLLIVRELGAGPKRYTDVLDGLPGMNTTLLAKRLRDLEDGGLVRRRRLPPPAASNVYELTNTGAELCRALLPLVQWGARHALGARNKDEVFHVEWPLLAMQASIDTARLVGVEATYEFRIDESIGYMSIEDGRVTVGSGPALTVPDVTITADVEAFVGVGTGRLDAQTMIAEERLNLEGDPQAIATLSTALGVQGRRRSVRKQRRR